MLQNIRMLTWYPPFVYSENEQIRNITQENSPMLVAAEKDSSQNPAAAVNEHTLLKGVDDEKIEMQEFGAQGNTFLLHNIMYTK